MTTSITCKKGDSLTLGDVRLFDLLIGDCKAVNGANYLYQTEKLMLVITEGIKEFNIILYYNLSTCR